MNINSLYAFYGSLRRGMMYYEVYKDAMEYKFSAQLDGFKLYALKEYPFAVKTNKAKDSIVVEVFKITDPETEKSIHELELGVGYSYDEIKVNSITAGIYLFSDPGNYKEVKDGDWVKFFGFR
jgi:gamma-glutamylcyclotransferase (GGCT)/AIG2-like uncharacterized protein YtfP